MYKTPLIEIHTHHYYLTCKIIFKLMNVISCTWGFNWLEQQVFQNLVENNHYIANEWGEKPAAMLVHWGKIQRESKMIPLA